MVGSSRWCKRGNGCRRVTRRGARRCNLDSETKESDLEGRPGASGQEPWFKKTHCADGCEPHEAGVPCGSACDRSGILDGGDNLTPFASAASLSPNRDRHWQVPRLTQCNNQPIRGQNRASPLDLVPSDQGHTLCAWIAAAALAVLELRLREQSLTQGRRWMAS